MPEALRQYLIRRRADLGKSQRELAALIPITQSALSDLESGKVAHPSLPTLVKWAAALDAELEIVVYERATVSHRFILDTP